MLYHNFLGVTFYQFIFNFMIYSTIGWLMETALCSVQEKKFVNRGFMIGPYCPIYGFGMNIIIILLQPISENILILYIGSVTLATVLEYLVSWILELVYKTRWWDYSQFRFNINGRVALVISLAWGGLAVFFIKFFQPQILHLLNFIPMKTGNLICYIFIIVFIADVVISTAVSAQLTKKLVHFTNLNDYFQDKLKEYIDDIQLKEKISSMKLPQLKLEYLNFFKYKDDDREKLSLNKRLNRYFEKIRNEGLFPSFNERRILNAFPKMKSKKYNDILTQLREKLQKK